MAKFMLTFQGGDRALRWSNLDSTDKAAQEKHLRAWKDWIGGLAETGKLETGYPLAADGKKVSADAIEDFHFPNSSPGGFVVLSVDSLDEAAKLAQTSPIVRNDGDIFVRPCPELQAA